MYKSQKLSLLNTKYNLLKGMVHMNTKLVPIDVLFIDSMINTVKPVTLHYLNK